MPANMFRGMKPFQQLLFSGFIIISSFLIFFILSFIIAIPFFGSNSIFSIQTLNDLTDPQNIRILKYFQVVQSIGLFVFPPFIIAWLFSGKIAEFLQLNKMPRSSSLLLILILTLVISPGVNFLGEMNAKMVFPEWLSGMERWMRNAENNAEMLTKAFLRVENVGGLFFNLFMIALIPALGEELLFRGVIQRLFSEWLRNAHWGIWISAFLFSALHLQFYGFVPRMLLGVLFGYLLIWSGNIWLPIIAHFVNNSSAVIALYMVDRKLISPDIEHYGATPGSFYLAFFSLVFGVLIMWIIWKQHRAEVF